LLAAGTSGFVIGFRVAALVVAITAGTTFTGGDTLTGEDSLVDEETLTETLAGGEVATLSDGFSSPPNGGRTLVIGIKIEPDAVRPPFLWSVGEIPSVVLTATEIGGFGKGKSGDIVLTSEPLQPSVDKKTALETGLKVFLYELTWEEVSDVLASLLVFFEITDERSFSVMQTNLSVPSQKLSRLHSPFTAGFRVNRDGVVSQDWPVAFDIGDILS
jgi:hypothetical protein